jgi:hypothetical protein
MIQSPFGIRVFVMKIITIVLAFLCSASSLMAQPVVTTDQAYRADRALRQSQQFGSSHHQKQVEALQERMQKQGIAVGQIAPIDTRGMDVQTQMLECVARNIGDEAVKQMDERHSEINVRIEELCKLRNSSEAMTAAKDYAKEMLSSREYKVISACAEYIGDKFKTDPTLKPMREKKFRMEGGKKDVCE